MIVQGVKKQVIDIEIDAEKVILDLLQTWVASLGLPPDTTRLSESDNLKRYWEVYERWGHGSDWTARREATDEEVEEYNALMTVASIAAQLD